MIIITYRMGRLRPRQGDHTALSGDSPPSYRDSKQVFAVAKLRDGGYAWLVLEGIEDSAAVLAAGIASTKFDAVTAARSITGRRALRLTHKVVRVRLGQYSSTVRRRIEQFTTADQVARTFNEHACSWRPR